MRFSLRWFIPRFSLRTLLIFVALVSAALAWLVAPDYRERRAVAILCPKGSSYLARRQHDTGDSFAEFWKRRNDPVIRIEALNDRGKPEMTDEMLSAVRDLPHLSKLSILNASRVTRAGLEYLVQLPELEYLAILDCPLSGDAFEPLSRLANMKVLRLRNCPSGGDAARYIGLMNSVETLDLINVELTDAGLSQLGHMKSLQVLYVENAEYAEHPNRITGSGLASFEEPRISRLSLSRNPIQDEELVHLESMPLHGLSIGNCEITDAALVHIGKVKSLTVLNLEHTKVTDLGLKALRALDNLRSLRVRRVPISREGIKYLRELPHLEQLYLDESRITDEALDDLANFPSLRYLSADFSPITSAGVARLKVARPELVIPAGTPYTPPPDDVVPTVEP